MTALTPEKLAGLRVEAAEAMRCRWYAQVLGADLLALLDALAETSKEQAAHAETREDLRCANHRNRELDAECEKLCDRLNDAEKEIEALKLDWPQ